MAKIGRNDPCSCGSGRKYKHCCREKAGRIGPVMKFGLLALVVVAVFFVVSLLGMSKGSLGSAPDTSCPPGEVWSAEHGHCHAP